MSVITQVQKLVKENPVVYWFIWGYFSCAIAGWLVLQLPLCQNSFVSVIDSIFTASSAISTTGLVTVNIEKTFSFPGQLVLFLLIEFGGIGYMVLSSFIILNLRKKMVTFIELIQQVLIYTFICEITGLIALYFFFKTAGVENSLWNALFHTASAFCTAGFSLFSSNLEGYRNHLGLNTIISLLSLLGAFGFFLSMSFVKKIREQKAPLQLAFRIIQPFATTAILVSAFLFFTTATFSKDSSEFQKWVISFFQVISTLTTAGFNTVEIRALPLATHLLLILLMLTGVSLTGNGMNMKNISFPALLKLSGNMHISSARYQKAFFRRMAIALSCFASYSVILLVAIALLNLVEKQPFLPLLFETASALCTIGISMGITSELSAFGKGFISLLMLIGRTGILILGFAISNKTNFLRMEKESI